MMTEEDTELTSSHKYIKNTFSPNTVFTEYLLNSGRRSQTPKSARSPSNWIGEKRIKKKKKKKGNLHKTCSLWRKLKEERFPHPGKTLTSGQISQDRKGAAEAWRGTQQPVCSRQIRERPSQRVHASSLQLPTPRHSSAATDRGLVWKLRL